MAGIDPDNVFSLFSTTDEEVFEEAGAAEYFNTPNVLLTSAINGLRNYELVDQIYRRQANKRYEELKEDIEYRYKNVLFGYIDKINMETLTEDDIEELQVNSSQKIVYLSELVNFFICTEDYEKCAVLKQLIDILEDTVGS